MTILDRYREAVASGALKKDAAQDTAVRKFRVLSDALRTYRPGRRFLFAPPRPPRGLYLWGDVGRGKSMLMDLFFGTADFPAKRRVHFNAFMVDVHERLHGERHKASDDPIAPVARDLAGDAQLLCFDEFQVLDVADAMILGRLFEQLFARGVVVVATSNVAPDHLYEGGLNRQLFLPFIHLLKSRLDAFQLTGPIDYRLHRIGGMRVYLTPLSAETDAAMDAAWLRLTDERRPQPAILTVLGRSLHVARAAKGVARFSFEDLCVRPLAAPDYLAIAQAFHTVMIDRIPELSASQRNEARRFIVLIDTLYDEGVKLICSAAVAPEALYREGDGAESFRRTASRLIEMQSDDYLRRGHGVHAAEAAAAN